MPPTKIHTAPSLDSFTPLADHQSQTPTTFYDAKPVLHYHAVGARALAAKDQTSKLPIFTSRPEGESASAEVEAVGSDASEVVTIDAFIGSDNLTLFDQTTATGISIPYPAISLHAIQRLEDPADSSKQVQGLYMQLELSDPYAVNEDDEPDTFELTLIPSPTSISEPDSTSSIQSLFEAVSNCSNLHPDPTQEDEDMEDDDGDSRIVFEGSVGYEGISGLPGVQRGVPDGGLPPPLPGSGGWITAENVSEYFDEDGNWIGETSVALGEGAGRVRGRDEVDGDGIINGHGENDIDDNKRPRTD